jgi:acetyl-CoA acetyltransferase
VGSTVTPARRGRPRHRPLRSGDHRRRDQDTRGGAAALIDQDEGIRAQTTAESLAQLEPAFGPAGTITAGNASQLSDGAAAVVA